MDRLISEKELLKYFDPRKDWVVVQTIKAIPSAYKGMTNGEVIEKLFKPQIIKKDDHIELAYNFDTDWWNSPYEPQESEDKE